MRIMIYADPHWCQYSSIVRKHGDKYSLRLENLIKSINWVEDYAKSNNCEAVINLGDFFDKSELNAEEITALNEINWASNLTHFNIIGNHEMGRSDLTTSSCDLFNLIPNNIVISGPCIFSTNDSSNCELAFLPYCLEENRNPIDFPKIDKKRVIFSHNDILGIQMGGFISKAGYSVESIEDNCDLCFNGHLHNGLKISDKIINVGNLTGQNFSEDANKYKHGCYILDTSTFKYEFIENPYAFNFYKFDLTNKDNVQLDVKSNAVLTIKCYQDQVDLIKENIRNNINIIESRVIICNRETTNEVTIQDNFSVDHIKQFKDYVLENLENTEVLIQELSEVCNEY